MAHIKQLEKLRPVEYLLFQVFSALGQISLYVTVAI